MDYRLKFTKEGPLQYIGHLDLMRLFQRAVKKAGIPIAYSTGFNPHQKMYFADPLPLFMESVSEYVDLELTEEVSEKSIVENLNVSLPAGAMILKAKGLEKGRKGPMSEVSAAMYDVYIDIFIEDFEINNYINRSEIIVEKKTKKSIKYDDIKNDIIKINKEDHLLNIVLAAGSSKNLKPELVVSDIYKYLNKEYNSCKVKYIRKELYRAKDGNLYPLAD